MRRCATRLCAKLKTISKESNYNKNGGGSYRPRFRPRRLVMPVNPSDVHSSLRSNNPLYEEYKSQRRLKRMAERRGVITLATVPTERSVGDAFRLMLDVCEKEGLFSESTSFTPKYLQSLEEMLNTLNMTTSSSSSSPSKSTVNIGVDQKTENCPHVSSFYSIGLSKERDISPQNITTSNNSNGIKIRDIDSIWKMLNNTPLNSPVHGILAQRGKSLIENYIANMTQEAFPRLRSKHLQAFIHECCGLLTCGRIALFLGFADICGVHGEINMWRELNILTERLNIAKVKSHIHLQRIEKGIPQQRRWYWRGVFRSAMNRLKLFPVYKEDLLPRMEWIRGSIFAFIAFIEIAEQSGDNVHVNILIKKLFCSQLGSFLHINQILDKAQNVVDEYVHKNKIENSLISHLNADNDKNDNNNELKKNKEILINRIQGELQKFRKMTEDELEILNEKLHPLNTRADIHKEQFTSSGGTHAIQSLRDDIFDDYQVTRHHKVAPPIILHCIYPQNALKEVQIILRYDPNIPYVLSSAPIDIDQVIRKVTEVHETNPYATLYTGQQYRQVEYTVCRLYAGKRSIGQGKGESLMEAINEAAQHTLLNYYLRKNPININKNDNNESNNCDINRDENDMRSVISKNKSLNILNEEVKRSELIISEIRVKETLDEEIIF